MNVGYLLSYESAVQGNLETETEKLAENTQSVATEGEAEKSNGYYLMELHGYVAVYYSDRTTLYELTEIPVTDLPAETQTEVMNGKYIASAETLYGFLENYSS